MAAVRRAVSVAADKTCQGDLKSVWCGRVVRSVMKVSAQAEDVRILLGREGAGELFIAAEELVVGAAGFPVDGGRGAVGWEQSVERGVPE